MGREDLEARVARTVPRQRSQENPGDPGDPEVQEGQGDLQQSPLVNQGGQELQVDPEAQEDPVVREDQEVLVVPEVQMAPKPQHHDRVYRQRSQQQENQEPQGGPEVLEVPEDPAVRVDRVGYSLDM